MTFLFQVEVGKDIPARVEVLDIAGERLYSSFFPLMGLSLEPASDYITLKYVLIVFSHSLFSLHKIYFSLLMMEAFVA